MRYTKEHYICFVLAHHPHSTRIEVMRRVHALEGKTSAFKPTSNHCYWSPTGNGNGGEMSVVLRGFVRATGKTISGRLTYELTALGQLKASELVIS